MRWACLIAVLLVAAAARPALAEVASSTGSGFIVRTESVVRAPPDAAARALGEIGHWWSADHTYSQNAANLTLELRAGGCFCEHWDRTNTVEHMRVLMVVEREGVRTVRLAGALGPLQDMGVTGILTFEIAPDPAGAKITMIYRVAGDPGLNLDFIAPGVDAVLMEQFARLIRYTETGRPT